VSLTHSSAPAPAVNSAPASAPADSEVAANADVVAGVDSTPDKPPPLSNTQVVRSGAYTLAGYLLTQALGMVGTMVLTRVLDREAFGIMAIVNTFLVGLALFSDIGIGPSIIQNPRGDEPKFLNTAWTLQFIRGTSLFLIAAALAVPAAWFFEAPALTSLIPVAAIAGLIEAVQSTKHYTAQKHLALGRITLIEISCKCAALAVMFTWALNSPSVWALVAGGLTGALTDVVLSHLLLPGYNGRFGWDKQVALTMMRFGRWIFISTLITFVVNQADRLIFAKMIPLAMLGVYSIALTVVNVPALAMRSLAGRVMFPLFSRSQHDTKELASVFQGARRLHLVLSGWALSGFIGGGAVAIRLVFDARYYEAGWMLQLLAVAAWCSTPEATNTQAALACGQPRWVAAGNFAKLVGMVVLIPLGFYSAGFIGALIGFVASELLRYSASAVAAYRLGLPALRQDLGFTLVLAAASLAGWGTTLVLERADAHVVLQALGVFLVATAVWSPWLLPYAKTLGPRLRRKK
jgi:O-antigen/teichoic acid export membrane protein